MIGKAARDPKNFQRTIVATDSARKGWELVLLTLSKGSSVLLPSYIGFSEREGSGIYDPIQKLKIAHEFYELDSRLNIPIESLAQQLDAGGHRMLLVVHYFGFRIKNIAEIAELCRQKNIVLVEDCAHYYNFGLSEQYTSDILGDYAFYSLHKFLPISNGGLLVSYASEATRKTSEEDSKFFHTISEYDIPKIVDIRRRNYTQLADLISNIDELELVKELGDKDIPQSLPVFVKNNLREKLYFWLRDREILTTALYYRLIDALDAEVFPTMHEVSRNILNLPIHQDIHHEDIIRMTDEIRSFYETERR